jgi:hypothetical protein
MMARDWSPTSEARKEGSSNASGGITRAGSPLSMAGMSIGGKSKVSLMATNQYLRRQAVNLLLEIVELREALSHRSGQPGPFA